MKIFYLPDLGEGLAEAEIREWYVKDGDEVKLDQPLVSMETAKAVVDVPSPFAGKIAKLHGKANDIIKTGAPLVSFEADEAAAMPAKNSVVGALEESSREWNEDEMIIGSAVKNKSRTNIKAMPAARILAQEMQIDLSQITPSGPQGLITLGDVKQFLAMHPSPEKSQTKTAQFEGENLHGVRRVMAQIMTQSHQEVVPVTIIEETDISHFPVNTDITARILQAMIAGINAEPALNAWFDGKKLTRKLFSEINIGIAVDTLEGLFVPVIKNAQQKSLAELRTLIDQYKKKVLDRTIPSSDLQGATISLSNFGTITGLFATPVIVPPAVAILGVGKFRDQAVVKNGQLTIGRILPFSLSFDHRAVTGGEATRFLGAVIKHLQTG